MSVNEVVYNGETLIDLKSDTVTPETLAEGVTAHAANGEEIVGTMPRSAVLYTEQELSVEEQAQARANIGAQAKENSVYYIEGTGTTAGTWLGSHSDITEYYPGLTVLYKVPIAGASATTLNINDLGAVTVVKQVTSAISTSYGVNAIVMLTYTVDSSGTAYWKTAEYDANTRNTVGDYRKNSTKLYLVGSASSDSATSSSYATSYTNSNCYIGTDNCLYSGGEKVANESAIPTALKNPCVLTINGKEYDGSEAVDLTEQVNALIDIKLGEIENGTY